MADNKRSATRYDRRLQLEYSVGGEWRTAFTRNVSLGGVFIEDEIKMTMGSRVQVRFSVPTQKEAIEVGATVRWMDSSGFGVQFDGLRAREVWALGKYFEQPQP